MRQKRKWKNNTKSENGLEEMQMETREGIYDLKGIRQFLSEEEGMGTVEVILIIVVLVGLVIVFKNQITQVVNNIFEKITSQTEKV